MKCIALLACEKLIIDKEGAHSIINVMISASLSLQQREGLEGPPENVPVPKDAVLPTQWFLYSVWDPSPNDVGISFEQVYQVYWPNGEKLAERRLQKFIPKDDTMMQTSFFFLGLPVGQEGKVRVKTWLDSDGHRVSDIIETAVRITHSKLATSPRGAMVP
jgi:hypothetical protein